MLLNIIIIRKAMKAEKQKIIEEIYQHSSKFSENAKNGKKNAYCKWTLEENMLYIKGLWVLRDQFSHEFHRRSQKVFLQMSKIIEQKTPKQCRTHHQKMMKKFDNIWNIIAFYLQQAEKPIQMKRKKKKEARQEQKRLARELGDRLTEANSPKKIPKKKISKTQVPESIRPHQNIEIEELQFESPVFHPQKSSMQQISHAQIFVDDIFFQEEELHEELSLNWNIDWNLQEYDCQQ